MINFTGLRWWTLGFSLATFIAAAIVLAIPPHLVPGIEFSSGSSFTLRFEEQSPTAHQLRAAMSALGHEARVQQAGDNQYLFRTEELQGAPAIDASSIEGPQAPQSSELDDIQAKLQEQFGTVTRVDFSTVSGTVSSEIARNATIAVLAASGAILLYIWYAFRRLPKPFVYGAAAVIALLHDAFVILGLFSLLGKTHGTEVDTAFITAILTVIGFSVHDTIVVYDRIREKVLQDPYVPFGEAVNASLTETLTRSINTSFVVVLTVIAMLLIGGETIQNFLIVLLVGIICGTYSSIGVAAQLVYSWENGDFGRFFRRLFGRGAAPRAESGEPGPVPA